MKTAFLILGAQRSGTSATSHLLSQLGVDFGDRQHFLQDHHNPIFFELQWVNDLNNQLIQSLGHRYTDFFLPLEADLEHPTTAAIAAQLPERLAQEWPHQTLIGLKDPRFCLTLPLWERCLRQQGIQIQILLVFRHPAGFLVSNQRLLQDWGWSETRHWQFWLQLNLAAVYFSRHCPVYWLDYDRLIQNPLTTAIDLAQVYQLDLNRVEAAARVIQPQHYHHTPGTPTGDRWVDECYTQMCQHTLLPAVYLAYRQSVGLSSLPSL